MTARKLLPHVVLFLATCVTTYLAGGQGRDGAIFAATLLGILVTHEAGHFIAARRHGLDVSLPYFIPLPFIGTGTLGAVIRMDKPIERRDALLDVGAAGPLAGLVVAIPLLAWGLASSPLSISQPPALVEGNSLLYLLLKLAIKGQLLPAANGLDVQLGPMALAAWVGLLLTFINLMPIGQLDGGHIAFAYFGDRHERASKILNVLLLAVGGVVIAWLVAEAHAARLTGRPAWSYAFQGALPWFIWAVLVRVMRGASGGRYHPPVGAEPLSPTRRRLAWLVLVIFILLVIPVPMRPLLGAP